MRLCSRITLVIKSDSAHAFLKGYIFARTRFNDVHFISIKTGQKKSNDSILKKSHLDRSYITARPVHLPPSAKRDENCIDVSLMSHRRDTAVSDSTSESHLTCKQHKESQTRGEVFKKSSFPVRGLVEGTHECFQVQPSAYLSNFM